MYCFFGTSKQVWGAGVVLTALSALLLGSAPGLAAAEQPFFVDLSAVVNTGLEDDGIPDNGQGGWTDEGVNDMYLFPPLPLGQNLYRGYPFHVLDPSKNNGRAALMLKGQERGRNRPEAVSVQVPQVKGRYLYFLQHAVGNVPAPDNYRVATYRIGYSDGTSVDIAMRDGIEIRQWWVKEWWDNREETRWPVHMGQNLYTQKWKFYIGLWATRWVNPHPQKPISTLEFKSSGKAAPILFAVTVSNRDYALQRKAPGNKVQRPPKVPEGYFAPKKLQESNRLFEEVVQDGHAQGLRQVELIRADVLVVTLDPALGKIGVGAWRQQAAAQGKPEAFRVESGTDAAFARGRQPVSVGRRSYEYWNGIIGGARQNLLYRHTYYLFLPQPLQSGHQYKVSVKGLEARFRNEMPFAYDQSNTVTPALKINQVAYASGSRQRYAYLGWWAGDAGAVDFSGLESFKILDDATGKTVLNGAIEGRKLNDGLSGEHVYQLDLSPLGPGRYHIVVPGLGRSDAFSVGGAKFRDLYYHTMRAFYHQRCGQALEAPFSEFTKPACHLNVSKRGRIVEGTGRGQGEIRHFRGGYHDAADFDIFSIHLPSTAQVLAAYEFSPKKFGDNDLNIPESGNGIPDLLDEADWGLATYRAMQREDGAIPYGRGNDQDSIRRWRRKNGSVPPYGVFPPDFRSSATYAAVRGPVRAFGGRVCPRAGRPVFDFSPSGLQMGKGPRGWGRA